jgi:predicted glycogen debranching enzyme
MPDQKPIPDPVCSLPIQGDLSAREWLVTNGLGGYASGTVPGALTRRYHGILVAALPTPYGRIVMLNDLKEAVQTDGGEVWDLCGERHCAALTDFRLELGLPVWRFDMAGVVLEKRLIMPHHQNTTQVVYRLLQAPGPVRLRLKPYIQFRGYEDPVDRPIQGYKVTAHGPRFEVSTGDDDLPPLRLHLSGQRTRLRLDGGSQAEVFYPSEADRGYAARGALWSPGDFAADLEPCGQAVLVASTESWHTCLALSAEEVREIEGERRRRLIRLADPALRGGAAAELVLAADQFVIRPVSRIADAARARSSGDDVRTVIAGYHWFTEWGRDTMISLEGLTMVTGRLLEAGWILRTFAYYVRDGLIPNMFPDGRELGLYHTADASLWFFHAVDRYLAYGGSPEIMRALLPKLCAIAEAHHAGTRFGIAMDPADGLMRQGQEGYQLTWMDAKVGDWVVTPRRGKAVEINALWYNAVCLLGKWLREHGDADQAPRWEALAERIRDSFNRRFWCDKAGFLYDVVDGEHGDDPSCRPNQVFAIALSHAVLDPQHWEPVMHTVRDRLLTPVGLRSLSPDNADYKPRYYGDLRARDAAYHQGTVWAWLIGPYIDAWLKLHPDDTADAARLLDGLAGRLDDFGLGTLAEIFDGEAPFHPRGCIAQAWSVAEWLRCKVKTAKPS